ncbi:MAG: chemotaxis protein CheA, partial [Rickettsiales bacterium]|nr:chemotaxis protein CheA [Rickettsiales bacterium]
DAMFPHFKGDEDPEMEAAIARILAKEAAGGASAPEAVDEPVVETKPQPVTAAVAPVAAKPASKPAPKADENGENKGESAGGANQTIRVNIDVLETLMQMVSELVLTRNQLMQIARTKEDKDFLSPLQQLSHITSELQEGVMKTRMQPIGNAWSKFPRLIRDLSLELGKKIDLRMNGAETELDRQLLEVIKDPLTHMVRNSCDHGLETPAERLAAGKNEMGTVILSAFHEGGHIIIEIKDDGRGINIDRVKQKAIAGGMATEAQLETMSEKQIAQFIFGAGFSTAEKVTSVSGRGVGMDVVKTNIEKIGGTIELDSEWGKGSKVAIKIPLTLAIVSVLLVEVNEQKFAIPQI